ncbi:hypothetical protein V1264_015149 [Littorina saxatilis]
MAATVQSHVIPIIDDAGLGGDAEIYDNMMRLTPAATPTPGQEMETYRCPVSTPANFVHPYNTQVRRTKPVPVSLEIALTPRSPGMRSAGGKPPRPGGATPRSQVQKSVGGKGVGRVGGPGSIRLTSGLTRGIGMRPAGPLNSRSLDYYYVDKAEEYREATETNTFWLRALCSQPVTEILDKYRRRSDFRRNRFILTKTCSTPGERSLLRAWDRNAPRVLQRLPARGYLPCAETQSLRPPHSKVPSAIAPSRPYHSEPFKRDTISHGYASDDDGDVTGDDITPADGFLVSDEVSIITPGYSMRQHSSSNKSAASSKRCGHSPERDSPEHDAKGNAYPVKPTYDISDHFQVTLPSVRDTKCTQERIGSPQKRNTMPFGNSERRHNLRDVRPDVTQPELNEVSRESTASRGGVSNSTTQPVIPRSTTMETVLPAIGRA